MGRVLRNAKPRMPKGSRHSDPAASQAMALVISSCDRYSGIWPAFFQLFWKYWPDCPYPVFLCSNDLIWDDGRVTTIPVGEDHGWSETTRAFLSQIPHERVLWLLDDFLLVAPVDTSEIERLAAAASELDATYLRLRANPPPTLPVSGIEGLGEIESGADYRAALEAAIWKRQSFIDLLRDRESPWTFELDGSRRSDALPGFYSTYFEAIRRLNSLEKGSWVRSVLPFLKREGIDFSGSGIPVMGVLADMRLRSKNIILPIVESPALRPAWERVLSVARPLKRFLKGASARR